MKGSILTFLVLLLLAVPAVAQAQHTYSTNAGNTLTIPRPPDTLDCAKWLGQTKRQADAALARADLSAYRGWIKFLRFEAENAVTRTGPASDLSRTNVSRLADWLQRIGSNPDVLGTLRGVQEWAYESPADDSGQPFRLNIPTDYDPKRPAGLSVVLHGNTGNHVEHSGWMHPKKGMFELAVLGRGRGGGYTALSEADVLQAMEYVLNHWRVDTNRIRLSGASMGGGGTLNVAAHYPHLFASARVVCGYAMWPGQDALPVENLLTVSIYAMHSADDWAAPILISRAPLARLRELGGQVIFDETNGFGHGVGGYTEGNQRGDAWADRQVRPDSTTVRRLKFTALSGTAARDWWAEILEWGPAPKPARFALVAGAGNTLYAELSNITRLRLRMAESPFDRAQPLRVSVNGGVVFEVPAPLPETLVVAGTPQGWHAEMKPELPSFRLHTPGGPTLLYDGSPLLIVYGTRGDTNLCKEMRLAAEAASKSPNPGWAADGGETGSEGVPHHQNLYGRLNVKADRDVTDADMQKCHLVLIGTAQQNSLVARLAGQLPVQWADGKISCSDGLKLGGTNQALGLVHYNPLAPQRLLYWVASDLAAFYQGARGDTIVTGADLLVFDLEQSRLVVARSFDSRWRWDSARATSPLMPAGMLSGHDLNVALAKALRRGTGADFVFQQIGTNTSPAFMLGTTRLADVTPLCFYQPIGLLDLSGTELIEAEQRRKAASKEEWPCPLYPPLEPGKIEPGRNYRVAVSADDVRSLATTFKITTPSFRMTDLETSEVLERFLLSDE
ncbi:MAG: hypothetical protein ABSD29_07775 [Verrucomicrobiota bacterium]